MNILRGSKNIRTLATILGLFSIKTLIFPSSAMAEYSAISPWKNEIKLFNPGIQPAYQIQKYRLKNQSDNLQTQIKYQVQQSNQPSRENTHIALSLPINELLSYCPKYPISATCSLAKAGSIEQYSLNTYNSLRLLRDAGETLCNDMFSARNRGQSGPEYVVSLVEKKSSTGKCSSN